VAQDLEPVAGSALASRKFRPAYEIAAARAAQRAQDLTEELFRQALHAEKDSDRRQAISLLFSMELNVRKERRDEEDHFSRLQGDELDKALVARLKEIGVDLAAFGVGD
jgi:hypothetical protein